MFLMKKPRFDKADALLLAKDVMVHAPVLIMSLLLASAFFGGAAFGESSQAASSVECPTTFPARPLLERTATYQNTPFKAGEKAVFEISYAGLEVGRLVMDVNPPVQYKGIWHRQFHSEVKTLEALENLYRVHDVMESVSDPQDFRIAKFYLKQDEDSLFSNRFRQSKFLEFAHEQCKVKETIRRKEKKDKNKEFDLVYGAKDSLGMVYYLRTLQYEIGTPVRTMVYSSEKNWRLEALPVAKEMVKVPAGEFEATKLKLITYLGKELQQQGDVFLWIAESPPRPIVLIQGEVQIGSLWFQLLEFEEGQP